MRKNYWLGAMRTIQFGLLTALIGAAVELAQTSGAVGVQLETAHTNLSGQKLYERLGFQREDLAYRTYFLKV